MTIAALLCLALAAVPASALQNPASRPTSRPTSRPAGFDQSHARLENLLQEHVADGRVDYRGLAKDRSQLTAYIRELRAVTPKAIESWTRKRRMAYWINVYNSHTLERILDSYPIKSIKDIGDSRTSVWDQRFIQLPKHHPDGKGLKLTLNEIEHGILRTKFRDPRIHAAVNCAAVSCPPLLGGAFTGKDLDRQLDERTRSWLANEKLNRYDARSKTLKLSRIFSWFAEDFGGEEGVREFITKYGPKALVEGARQAKRIEYVEYDWLLNDGR